MEPRYRFGRFELRPLERQLLESGRPVPIGSRAFDLLVILAASQGHVVSKDELIERVWPRLVVEENNLQVQVSKLRRLLGREAIATVAGRGYQLTLREGPGSPDERQDAADEAAPSGPPLHNLPAERSTFIGRDSEIAACARLLGNTRLLSILAIGGCGKTRLALELARELAPDVPDGVWFIDLAPLQEAGRVPIAIGASLRVFEQPGTPLSDALSGAIGNKHMLLVLDNCEQVVGAVSELVEVLLSRCARLQVIVTSRVALCHPLERVYALPPLALPATTSESEAVSFDAVRMFIDRLQWADPDFRLDASNVATAVDICRRLDGIPLALELAAARIKVLSLHEIREKLDDRFKFLTGSSRALPRHQTLRATIQWSYDQLPPALQQRFRLLGVVAGSWTLATATALAGDAANDHRGEFDMLDAMSQLVDQSLVNVQHGPGGETRYRFLETVRVFARECLREAGEEAAARTRHLRCYAALVDHGSVLMQGAQQGAWLQQLDAERENIVLAHAWCDNVIDGAELGLVLIASLQGYWRSRGLIDLGYRLACEAVIRADGVGASVVHAKALFCAGDLAYFLGRHHEAADLLSRSKEMAAALGDVQQQAWSQLMLGVACLGLGEWDAGRSHAASALALARSDGDSQVLNTAVMAMSVIHLALGELEDAQRLLDESLSLARKRGAPINVGVSLVNIAWAAIGQRRAPPVREALTETIEIVLEIGHESIAQMVIDAFVGLSAITDEWEDAARFYGAAQASIDYTRLPRQPAIVNRMAPLVEATRAAIGTQRFEELQADGRHMSHADALRIVQQKLHATEKDSPPSPIAEPSSAKRRIGLADAWALTPGPFSPNSLPWPVALERRDEARTQRSVAYAWAGP